MKEVIIREVWIGTRGYLVSDEDANRIAEAQPSDANFKVQCWWFSDDGFKKDHATIVPQHIEEVVIKDLPA